MSKLRLLPFRTFRSASSLDFIVPRTRTKFGVQAISAAGPTVWNSLPESVKLATSLASFQRKLKTYRFNISF